MMSSGQDGLPESSIPIFTTVKGYREWRRNAYKENKSVGFVATMGALHEGHLSLVRRSLAENDHTVLSIFVNPAQFAPHEDLATYPRTLPRDLELLTAQSLDVTLPGLWSSIPGAGGVVTRKASAVFVPNVQEMYPSGIVQDVSNQKGTFVEVKGYGDQMEGKSRPTFFRGVATVVTKLFNVIEPTNTYFGQKDIQQALLLRRMCRDLLLSHPTPETLHIVPTSRDPSDGLALSSRNAYLSTSGRRVASTLREALSAAQESWTNEGLTKSESLEKAVEVVEKKKRWVEEELNGEVNMRLDYIEMNDVDTFEVLDGDVKIGGEGAPKAVILSGALWVDKTRLIDNIILGDSTLVFGPGGGKS
ncbi:Pantoate-beta-alanine ligase [Pluteus cervinus]|uniref:Pantoate-beta-alanine ligase n=1 Tax=Pluteus cervinus TaxID=181527 RepID=A0ACD3AEK3_9AGAR|nr:Pantoate-beta-alanine ligase [Pluteus cervinus]